jgi:hypothetical protein
MTTLLSKALTRASMGLSGVGVASGTTATFVSELAFVSTWSMLGPSVFLVSLA